MIRRYAATIRLLLVMAGSCSCYVVSAAQRKDVSQYVDTHGIRIKVPAGYEERKSSIPSVVAFENLRDSHSLGLLKVYFEHRPTAIPGHELTPEKMERFGLTKTGEKQLAFAGRDGGCVEYSVKTKPSIALAQAECSFGTDLHTSFFGRPENLKDFYDLMDNAKPWGKEQQA